MDDPSYLARWVAADMAMTGQLHEYWAKLGPEEYVSMKSPPHDLVRLINRDNIQWRLGACEGSRCIGRAGGWGENECEVHTLCVAGVGP